MQPDNLSSCCSEIAHMKKKHDLSDGNENGLILPLREVWYRRLHKFLYFEILSLLRYDKLRMERPQFHEQMHIGCKQTPFFLLRFWRMLKLLVFYRIPIHGECMQNTVGVNTKQQIKLHEAEAFGVMRAYKSESIFGKGPAFFKIFAGASV